MKLTIGHFKVNTVRGYSLTFLLILSFKALAGTDVSPFFKKENHIDKSNCQLVSILPSCSKIYEHHL